MRYVFIFSYKEPRCIETVGDSFSRQYCPQAALLDFRI